MKKSILALALVTLASHARSDCNIQKEGNDLWLYVNSTGAHYRIKFGGGGAVERFEGKIGKNYTNLFKGTDSLPTDRVLHQVMWSDVMFEQGGIARPVTKVAGYTKCPYSGNKAFACRFNTNQAGNFEKVPQPTMSVYSDSNSCALEFYSAAVDQWYKQNNGPMRGRLGLFTRYTLGGNGELRIFRATHFGDKPSIDNDTDYVKWDYPKLEDWLPLSKSMFPNATFDNVAHATTDKASYQSPGRVRAILSKSAKDPALAIINTASPVICPAGCPAGTQSMINFYSASSEGVIGAFATVVSSSIPVGGSIFDERVYAYRDVNDATSQNIMNSLSASPTYLVHPGYMVDSWSNAVVNNIRNLMFSPGKRQRTMGNF